MMNHVAARNMLVAAALWVIAPESWAVVCRMHQHGQTKNDHKSEQKY
ncbi:MAG: hypothetical protein ACLGJC_18410 [Alphaproteobacteria bacterium]